MLCAILAEIQRVGRASGARLVANREDLLCTYSSSAPGTFVGHLWRSGSPRLTRLDSTFRA
jgi:hypothetical protein